jgi:hypothetical protein
MEKGAIRMNENKCERCRVLTLVTTMSWLNQDMLCLDCKEKEKKYPRYLDAKKIESKYVKSGNYNYRGLLFDQKI